MNMTEFRLKTLILGGGLAGLSCSYYIGHENCLIVEKNPYLGGHATTHFEDGAYWDEGPHVSFTKHEEVAKLLTTSCVTDIREYSTEVGNFYSEYWIPHPAQSNLYALPNPLAKECLDDFIKNQNKVVKNEEPTNYREWLDEAFGVKFSRTFPHAYTRKYWTCDPVDLSVDWVGSRVFKPDLATVINGYQGMPKKDTHYINSVRYPYVGGFDSFFDGIRKNVNHLNDEVVSINLSKKIVFTAKGASYEYKNLISTLPLDQFISLIANVPKKILEASETLRCSSLLLVNILGSQVKKNPYHWLYVYDENKYSTRITQTHLLSSENTPEGIEGIQVEVYASPYRPFEDSFEHISHEVVKEVKSMKLLDDVHSFHFKYIPHANVIFDNNRRKAQDIILTYLESFGLTREEDDLEPMTNWQNAYKFNELSPLALAGRFGQWKYFWSDDCILRGKQLGGGLDK